MARVLGAAEYGGVLVFLDLSGSNLTEFLTDRDAPGVLFECLSKSQQHLATLDLSGNLLTASVAQDLADVLPRMTSLTSLDLSRNNLHSRGVAAVAESLDPEEHQHSAIRWLSVAENSAGLDPATPHPSSKAAVALGAVIRNSVTLRGLDVSHNDLGAKAISHLAAALAENDGLIDLRLDGNRVDVDGALALAESPGPCASLTRLSLRGTSLTGDGAVALAAAMASMKVGAKAIFGGYGGSLVVLTDGQDTCHKGDGLLDELTATTQALLDADKVRTYVIGYTFFAAAAQLVA